MRTQIIAPVITRKQAKQQLNERTDCRLTDQACDKQEQKRNVDIPVDKSCVIQPNELHTPAISNDSNKMFPFTIEQ
ncbi:unnamed protein product, partial [Rotaria socialis]